jgi:hypothetical protein
MIAGVWYRLPKQMDFQRMKGHEYKGCDVIGGHGWLGTECEGLVFDPAQPLDVWWRDARGAFHRGGYYPDAIDT